MKSEKSLVKIPEGSFNKIINFFKKLFSRNKYNNEIQNEKQIIENSKINDFEVLKEIIEGSSTIESLDVDTKKRLIVLCSKRLEEITKKIDDKNLEIKKMELFLASLN